MLWKWRWYSRIGSWNRFPWWWWSLMKTLFFSHHSLQTHRTLVNIQNTWIRRSRDNINIHSKYNICTTRGKISTLSGHAWIILGPNCCTDSYLACTICLIHSAHLYFYRGGRISCYSTPDCKTNIVLQKVRSCNSWCDRNSTRLVWVSVYQKCRICRGFVTRCLKNQNATTDENIIYLRLYPTWHLTQFRAC